MPWMSHLSAPVLLVAALVGFMAMIDTLSLSIRVSAVLTRRLAVALSLFNIIVLAARLSNIIQAPILGSLGDYAATRVPQQWLQPKLHIIIFGTTLGTLVGALLTPSFVHLFRRLIELMEEHRTAPRALLAFFAPSNLRQVPALLRWPRLRTYLHYMRQAHRLPLALLVWQMLVTGFYTIGVISTVYAAALYPDLRLTAANLSGVVNGIATLLLFLIVDPPAAMVIDHCIAGKRPPEDAKILNVWMVTMRFLGTLLAQLLLVPMAYWVSWIARLIYQGFYG